MAANPFTYSLALLRRVLDPHLAAANPSLAASLIVTVASAAVLLVASTAVNDVSFSARPGGIFGLLGPNSGRARDVSRSAAFQTRRGGFQVRTDRG